MPGFDDDTYNPAHPDAVKDLWLSCARPLNAKGKLETMPTRRATNMRERDIARNQNHWVSRSVFHVPSANFDLIDWSK